MKNNNTTLNQVQNNNNQLSEEDKLIIKIIFGGALFIVFVICVGLIVRSVRQVINPADEFESKPKDM